MGKVILCCGRRAKNPYRIKSVGVNIYTAEEMCYYISSSMEQLSEDDFDLGLADFYENELELAERGELLRHLINVRAGFKDIITAIICSCDFFDEQEAKGLLEQFDRVSALSRAGRQKLRADKYMREGRYSEALFEYQRIIGDKKNVELTAQEYGNVLHNIAVLTVKSGAYDTAAETFLKAYERNHRSESLKQYLYALKLGRHDDRFAFEKAKRVEDRRTLDEIQNELAAVEWEQTQIPALEELENLKSLRNQGRIADYDRLVGEMIGRLKKKYRQEN